VDKQSPDKKILSILDKEGLGIFRNIAPDLIEIWPEPDFPQDYPDYVAQVQSFVKRLVKDQLIEVDLTRSFGFYRKFGQWHDDFHNGFRLINNPLYAHITKTGHDFLVGIQENGNSSIVITGDSNQIIQHSPSAKNSKTPTKREKKSLGSTIKKWVGIGISICTLVGMIWKGGEYLGKKKQQKSPSKVADSLTRGNFRSDTNHIQPTHMIEAQKKKSASIIVRGNNNITQGGNHNSLTVINPTQNNYITTGFALSADSLNTILRLVENACPIDMEGTHNVILAFGHASNGQRVFQQIETLLSSKGYHVLHGGPVLDTYFGVKFLDPTPPDCVWIVVGIFS